MTSLKIDVSNRRYQAMIGVGGIGSGRFFALKGNHTLGREESRGGRFLGRRDYCKLHIVCHYVKVLLGPEFITIPIGKVGDDEEGYRLFYEMKEAGLDTRYVKISPGDQTLFSFCFIYPNGSGGNLTTDDSASAKVDGAFMVEAEREFVRFEGRGVALAVPEVSMEARQKLLQLGTDHRFFRVASFTSEEMNSAIATGILHTIDLLAINLDEAAAVVGISAADRPPLSIVETAIEMLCGVNPDMLISITAGRRGSWSWDGESLVHVAAFRAEVASTAGAGDTHMSGIIAGLVAGLTMAEAQELGTLTAALSVTSPHTINKDINSESLRVFAARIRAPICDAVKNLLED